MNYLSENHFKINYIDKNANTIEEAVANTLRTLNITADEAIIEKFNSGKTISIFKKDDIRITFTESTGKTVEEAIFKALDELNITAEEVFVEILENEQKTFFGLWNKTARVRITTKILAEIENFLSIPSTYDDFKTKYLIHLKNYNHEKFINFDASKFWHIDCLIDLFEHEQPNRVLHYLDLLTQEKYHLRIFTFNEIKTRYKVKLSEYYNRLYDELESNFMYDFEQNYFYNNNPLVYYFRRFHNTHILSRPNELLILLRKYLLKYHYINEDLSYSSLLNQYITFLNIKEKELKFCQEQLSTLIMPFINSKEIWPSSPQLSELDIKAIRKLIDEKITTSSPEIKTTLNNFNLSTFLSSDEFEAEVITAITNLRQEKFNVSFLKLYEKEFGCSDNKIMKNNCFTLFISIFHENDSFISYLKNFIKNFAVDSNENLNSNQIKSIINKMREEISISSHIENLKYRMCKETFVQYQKFTIDDIDILSGLDFELFLEKLFTKMGYSVQVTKSTGDQGADLVLSKFGRKIAVQAKRYNTKLDNTPIQEIIGAKAYYDCTETMVVTNSYFTKKAIELAQVNNVQLIDRDDLIELLETYPIVKND